MKVRRGVRSGGLFRGAKVRGGRVKEFERARVRKRQRRREVFMVIVCCCRGRGCQKVGKNYGF